MKKLTKIALSVALFGATLGTASCGILSGATMEALNAAAIMADLGGLWEQNGMVLELAPDGLFHVKSDGAVTDSGTWWVEPAAHNIVVDSPAYAGTYKYRMEPGKLIIETGSLTGTYNRK